MARVLVLGSQQAEREGLASVMETAGHQCASAGSLEEAIELLQKEAYDLVLADSVIGETSTAQIIPALKDVSPSLAVRVLTEEASPPARREETLTLSFSPRGKLPPQFSALNGDEAVRFLLPERDSLARIPKLPQTPSLLNKLAVLYHSQEKYLAAELLYKRALALAKKTKGQHREVATIINNLAMLYHDQKKFAEAERLYNLSLAMVTTIFGSNHPKAATRLRNLAELYKAQGRNAEAGQLHKRIQIIEQAAQKAGQK